MRDGSRNGVAEIPGRHPTPCPRKHRSRARRKDAGRLLRQPDRADTAASRAEVSRIPAWDRHTGAPRGRPRLNVVDSSAWLEYFADGPRAGEFARTIEAPRNLLVPSITLFEFFKTCGAAA